MGASAAIATEITDTSRNAVCTSVRHAWRGVALARGIESVLVAATAFGGCLAAALHGGADVAGPHPWIAASGVALLAGGSWWIEHRPSVPSVARRLDRIAGHHGALVAALESELRGDPTDVEALLSQRVSAALADRSRPRLERMPSMVSWAAPFAALAVLMFVVESRTTQIARAVRTRTQALSASVAALDAAVEQHGATLPPSIAADARAIGRTVADMGRGDRAAWSEVASRAERAADALPVADAVQRALADVARRAHELVEARFAAATMDSSAVPSRSSSDATAARDTAELARSSSRPSQRSTPTGQVSRVDAGASLRDESSPGVAVGAADGTMPGLESAGPPSTDRDSPLSAVGERGLPALRWWPRRFDPIVERWIEGQRVAGDR